MMEATKVEIEQPYWMGIHDSLADGIQFIENHARLMESTERFPQRPAKKRHRFSRVLDTQIQIPIRQPHPPTSPLQRSHSPPPHPVADSASRSLPAPPVADSPAESTPHPPIADLAARSPPHSPAEFRMSLPSHRTPAAPGSPPPSQAIHPIQIILITST